MIILEDKKKCSGCHACASICPQNCIQMTADSEGFLYPKIDVEKCNNCRLCEKVCPVINTGKVREQIDTKAYAAKNTDEYIRKDSSSGGIFTLLAERILKQNGIVFGAAFNQDFELEHIGVEAVEDLQKLRGSKYVQSKIGDTYRRAKIALEEGRKVLFTGTPCQISGLKAFLRKDYQNLYTQDLICHGVPSPMIWEQYICHLEEKYGGRIERVRFRNKEKSWKKYAIDFYFSNGEHVIEPFMDNSYMKAFLRNLSLRPSCYSCAFKGVERVADITLADFWGIENTLPQMDDDKGTSLVLIHSDKGKALLKAIASRTQMQEVDTSLAICENGSAVYSSRLSPKRKSFFARLKKTSFDKNVKKCITPSLYIRIKNLVKRILRKIKLTIGRK